MNRKYQGHEKTWNLLHKNWLQRDCDAKHGKASTKIGKTWEKIVERWTGLANHDDHSDPTKSLFGVDRGDIWGHQKTDKQLVPSFFTNPVARRFQRHPFCNHVFFVFGWSLSICKKPSWAQPNYTYKTGLQDLPRSFSLIVL